MEKIKTELMVHKFLFMVQGMNIYKNVSVASL